MLKLLLLRLTISDDLLRDFVTESNKIEGISGAQPYEVAVSRDFLKLDQITIPDARVAALRVSGQFRAGDSQRFAETLAEMHGLRALRKEHRIELVRK